eukprot:5283675-Lingulodinium_polyedra.AAC.1
MTRPRTEAPLSRRCRTWLRPIARAAASNPPATLCRGACACRSKFWTISTPPARRVGLRRWK